MKTTIKLSLFALIIFSSNTCFAQVFTPYGVEKDTIIFVRDEADVKRFINSIDFETGDCASSACCQVSVDQGVVADCDNQPVAHGGGCYVLTLAATRAEASEIVFYIKDAAVAERFSDTLVKFHTYGDVSAWSPSLPANIISVTDTAVTDVDDFKLTAAEILNTDLEDYAVGMGAYIDTIKKYVSNKLSISGGNYTLYKDDETTTFDTGTTGPTGRNPD